MTKKIILTTITSLLLLGTTTTKGQTVSQNNIHSFEHQGKRYQIITEMKTWIEATEYATNQGGYLAEINNQEEQDAIYNALQNNIPDFSINPPIAQDGGGASYAWIGGNDIQQEGSWVWNGNNNENKTPFWQGGKRGDAIDNQYSNWGTTYGEQNEPDNYLNNQDGVAIALNNWPQGIGSWPLGNAGQWNDLAITNKLYFVIEYPITTINHKLSNNSIILYPNPTRNYVTIQNTKKDWQKITIYTITGETLLTQKTKEEETIKINLSNYPKGIYIIECINNKGEIKKNKIIKK